MPEWREELPDAPGLWLYQTMIGDRPLGRTYLIRVIEGDGVRLAGLAPGLYTTDNEVLRRVDSYRQDRRWLGPIPDPPGYVDPGVAVPATREAR